MPDTSLLRRMVPPAQENALTNVPKRDAARGAVLARRQP